MHGEGGRGKKSQSGQRETSLPYKNTHLRPLCFTSMETKHRQAVKVSSFETREKAFTSQIMK
jgi:hypothetical protein